MSLPTIQPSLNAGELSPAIFGRVDLDKYKKGTSTCRNMFASYRGGVTSRPGTLFCGVCKQGNAGQANNVPPPRNIPFQFNVSQGITIEAGQNYFRFLTSGSYITEAPQTVTAIASANPAVITVPSHGFSNGDEVFLAGVLTRMTGQSYIVSNTTTNTFVINSTLTGLPINATGFGIYTGVAGTAARIYTLATPYAAVDLPYLKYTQSADVMTLTCVNTATKTSYAPYDLARVASANWTLTKTSFGTAISAPASIAGSTTQGGSFFYQFVMTAVDAATGQESSPSPPVTIESVDIATQAGTINLYGASVTGAGSYNFYSAPACYQNPPASGSFFGYLGSSFGPSFSDTNIVPDFTTTPPLHRNPFATSSVIAVPMSANGSGYSQTATTATVISPIGDNPSLTPIIVNGGIVWTVVNYGGSGMTGGETVTFTDSTGGGSLAAAMLTIGPSTGTFPSCAAYFQQRRIYADTLNEPDTYFASQPGAFTNMDTSLPVVASDAIVGSPWSQQVNGIQWMLNMPGGLVIFTGLGAWQLSGGGGGLATSAPLTPENQVANPQAYNGCSPTVPPIPINYDILYVQEKGSIVRDLSYNFFVNIYTGTDMTVLSNHLFDGHTIVQWAWAEEPNKLLWAIRDDGILLCLTYLKEQDVYAWSRHDSNGLFQSVCTVSEPPVNAPYFVVKRLIQLDGDAVWAYFQERMDNRQWINLESSWCVDAGLTYPANQPNATLSVSSDDGVLTLTQPNLVYGGANFSASTFAEVVDPTGVGAIGHVTVVGGIVTAVSVSGTLTGYTMPVFRVVDPTGAGGGAVVNITTTAVVTVTTNAPVFTNAPGAGEAGDIIHMGGRQIQVTQFISSDLLTGNILQAHEMTIPDDPLDTPIPAPPGQWSITAPTSVVYGLDHLDGMTVSILADGIVVQPQIVVNGSITLPQPATQITVGLGFTAQMQTMYLEIAGGVTVQGRRKEIDSIVVRIDQTGCPFDVGVNQPDASRQPGMITVPWTNMTGAQGLITGDNIPLQPYDLNSNDVFLDIFDQVGGTFGQVAVQQTAPLPLTVLAVVPFTRIQDDSDAA